MVLRLVVGDDEVAPFPELICLYDNKSVAICCGLTCVVLPRYIALEPNVNLRDTIRKKYNRLMHKQVAKSTPSEKVPRLEVRSTCD